MSTVPPLPLIPKAIVEVLNEGQLDTLRGYLSEHPEFHDALVRATELFQGEALKERLVRDVVVPINLQKLRGETQRRIDEGHWSVMAVGGDEDVPSFAYSVGLSKHCGVEVFCSGIGGQTACTILNELAEQVKENPHLTPRDLKRPLGHVKDQSFGARVEFKRVRLIDTVNTHCYAVKTHLGDVSPEATLLVVVLPDANNVLPGEEGYDTNFRQILFNDLPTQE